MLLITPASHPAYQGFLSSIRRYHQPCHKQDNHTALQNKSSKIQTLASTKHEDESVTTIGVNMNRVILEVFWNMAML